MKQDIFTTVIAAILGLATSFVLVGMVIPEIKEDSFKILDSNTTYDIIEPDPDIFNARAINPTVEVHVGQCEKNDESGECLDDPDKDCEEYDESGECINDLKEREPSEEN